MINGWNELNFPLYQMMEETCAVPQSHKMIVFLIFCSDWF